jgi:acetyl-CoA acetyltransferase
MIEAGLITERQMAEVAVRTRKAGMDRAYNQVTGDFDVDALLAEDYVRSPLRRHDLPPITDGACALVIARADKARELVENPIYIRGFAHYSELHYPGFRDLLTSNSTMLAAKAAGIGDGPIEVAEIQSAFTHEESLLASALGLGRETLINPSGGPQSSNPIMATGLVRIAEAAGQIRDNGKHRTLGHSTSGPCLQQNLVCILEDGGK